MYKVLTLMDLFAEKDAKHRWDPHLASYDYHGLKNRVGSSQLREALISGKRFEWRFKNPPQSDSRSIRLGLGVHAVLLEPEKVSQSIAVSPGFSGTGSKAAKASWESSLLPGTLILSNDERCEVDLMADSVMSHPTAAKLLKASGAHKEVTGLYIDPETQIQCKIRPDIYLHDQCILVDIKSTRSIDKNDFSKEIWNYRYDFQIAMYAEGIKEITGSPIKYAAFICVENEPPFDSTVYIADDVILEKGRQDYFLALQKLKSYLDKNEFDRYQQTAETISLPPWVK